MIKLLKGLFDEQEVVKSSPTVKENPVERRADKNELFSNIPEDPAEQIWVEIFGVLYCFPKWIADLVNFTDLKKYIEDLKEARSDPTYFRPRLETDPFYYTKSDIQDFIRNMTFYSILENLSIKTFQEIPKNHFLSHAELSEIQAGYAEFNYFDYLQEYSISFDRRDASLFDLEAAKNELLSDIQISVYKKEKEIRARHIASIRETGKPKFRGYKPSRTKARKNKCL